MTRILIAVPTYESITPDTYKSLWDMDKGGNECLFEFMRGYDCATARNKCAEKAFELNADYLLMVDSDITVPRDALVNLLSHGVDVVSGYYAHRNRDNDYTGNTCACRLCDVNGKPYFDYPIESEYTADDMREMRRRGEYLMRIHGGGMGCILIRTSVFDEVRFPWFDWVNCTDNQSRKILSEDLFFCEQLINEEIPLYVDTRVSCGHLFRHIQHVN